jgi:hypothetical protein
MHSPDPAAANSFTPRPEQTFFPEPAVDRAMGVIMALATEVYVMRDRQFALERLLAERGVLDLARLDAEPSPADAAAMAADREAFVGHILSSVLGVQASKGMLE